MGKTVAITTFNCGKAFPYNERAQCQAAVDALLPQSSGSSDMYVLGLQELLEIWEASFSEMVESVLERVGSVVVRVLKLRYPEEDFKVAATSHIGAMALVVVVRSSFEVQEVRQAFCRRGMLYSNLKGCTTIHMNVRESPQQSWETFVLINCHLAANEGVKNRDYRVSDCNEAVRTAKETFRLQELESAHVLFMGDLNFRNMYPVDVEETDYANAETRRDLLRNCDELTVLKGRGDILQGFQEPLVTFPPTFKYNLDDSNTYNPKRTPAWCDRVLYSAYANEESSSDIQYTAMDRSEPLLFTDHQPVNLRMQLPQLRVHNLLPVGQPIPSSWDNMSNAVDMSIGYGGWLVSLKIHYILIALLCLYIAYKWWT